MSRVRRGALGGGQSQSYTYDGFGNLTSVTTSPVGPEPDPVLNVSGSTNRLASVSYDEAGNQLGWGAYQYAYDPFNMMRSMTGTGNNWRYLYTADDERVGQEPGERREHLPAARLGRAGKSGRR